MSTKRKSVPSSSNFRPSAESQKWETKGTKPSAKPVSVSEALLTMVIHVCRKFMFLNTNIKVGLYAAGLFLSFVGDVYPFPKSYFARSDNMFNQYFVKLGWAWTLAVTIPFASLSSFTYCCGKRNLVLKHIARLGVATVMWFVFTKSFAYIEQNYGKCSVKGSRFATKQACLSEGHFWHSLDISGHAFILIYSALVIIEEGRAIIGWETIKDFIRNEEHTRTTGEEDLSSPLRYLADGEFRVMKASYEKFSPYVRANFIGMTFLVIIWDLMIMSTILYFHVMVEKLISGVLAIVVWFLTYKVWFALANVPPCLPGEGLFKYNKITKKTTSVPLRSRASFSNANSRPGDLPKFMGMPLYGLRTPQEQKEEAQKDENATLGDVGLDFTPKANLNSGNSRWRPSQSQMSIPIRQGAVTRSQASTARSNGNVTI